MYRNWGSIAILVALASCSSVALAASQHKGSYLKPGPAAGVHQAENHSANGPEILIVGAGVVIGGVALVVSGSGNKAPTSTSTGAKSTNATTSTSTTGT